MEIIIGILFGLALVLVIFLAAIFPMAAYRAHRDLPKIVDCLNEIITILKTNRS